MKSIFTFFEKHNLLFSLVVLGIATIFSFFYSQCTPGISTAVELVYVLAVVTISRYTKGYWYGILTSFVAVIAINYFFTHPYFFLDFTLSGYPVTFIGILTISIITSATTSNLKQQAIVIAERDNELLEREIELLEAEKEKMRANLLRAVSHDIRTPLTSIIGAASTYTANSSSYTEEEKQKLVRNIYDDANWLLHMVENLLSITRIQNECQKVSTTLEIVDEVIAESVLRFKKRYPSADVEVAVPDEILMIPMDAMLIEQVLINLLENAIIHAPSEKPPLLLVASDEKNVTFYVYDYGPGISEERFSTLFDGTSGKPTSTNLRKGMGLGLSICKTIILAHNGDLMAENHDSGAVFYFTLPKEESHEF